MENHLFPSTSKTRRLLIQQADASFHIRNLQECATKNKVLPSIFNPILRALVQLANQSFPFETNIDDELNEVAFQTAYELSKLFSQTWAKRKASITDKLNETSKQKSPTIIPGENETLVSHEFEFTIEKFKQHDLKKYRLTNNKLHLELVKNAIPKPHTNKLKQTNYNNNNNPIHQQPIIQTTAITTHTAITKQSTNPSCVPKHTLSLNQHEEPNHRKRHIYPNNTTTQPYKKCKLGMRGILPPSNALPKPSTIANAPTPNLKSHTTVQLKYPEKPQISNSNTTNNPNEPLDCINPSSNESTLSSIHFSCSNELPKSNNMSVTPTHTTIKPATPNSTSSQGETTSSQSLTHTKPSSPKDSSDEWDTTIPSMYELLDNLESQYQPNFNLSWDDFMAPMSPIKHIANGHSSATNTKSAQTIQLNELVNPHETSTSSPNHSNMNLTTNQTIQQPVIPPHEWKHESTHQNPRRQRPNHVDPPAPATTNTNSKQKVNQPTNLYYLLQKCAQNTREPS